MCDKSAQVYGSRLGFDFLAALMQLRVGMYNLQLDIVDKNNLKSHIACQPIHNNIFKLGMQ